MTLEGTHNLWGDLCRPNTIPAETDFTIIGIPYDGLASCRKGAALAPERMRFWSRHLTPYSQDRTRLGVMSICDLGDIEIKQPERDFEQVRQLVAGLPNIPILLGGDHSVTIPILQGQRQRFKDQRLGILWLDAHPDLCNDFDGSPLSHACTLRRGLEAGIAPGDICMIGLRSWEEQEIDLIENGELHVYDMTHVEERGIKAIAAEARQILSACDAIHISLDIDCLDPSAAPGTGIPDYGGLTMREVITLLKALESLPLAGLDLVEVAPPLDPSEATIFAALKIIMEFIAVRARSTTDIRHLGLAVG